MPATASSPERPAYLTRQDRARRRDPRRAGQIVQSLASLLILLLLTAGLPAALGALGGSPVPGRLPAWHQVITALARPDNGSLFLGAVRWISWLAWAVFAACVIAETAGRLRRTPAWRIPLASPVQAAAGVLVGSVFLGLLPGQHLPRAAVPVPRPGAAACAAPVPARAPHRADAGRLRLLRVAPGPGRTGASPVPRRQRYVVADGDSLWAIAARMLGDGQRWQEIFAINRGTLQPDGRRLADPDLIIPGWVLTLPYPPSRIAYPRHRPPARARPPHGGQAPSRRPGTGPRPGGGRAPAPDRPPGPHPAHHPAAATPRQRPGGISLPGGGLVGITLAAAISTALVAWRAHRRHAAEPCWPPSPGGRTCDIPAAIRVLRRAHLRSLAAEPAKPRNETQITAGPGRPGEPDEEDTLDEFGAPSGRSALGVTGVPPGRDDAAGAGGPPGLRGVPRDLGQPAGAVVFGFRGRDEIPLADVARPVLGLTGPGAYAAARALMIGVLAAPGPPASRRARVVIPAPDARLLTGRRVPALMPGVTAGWPDGLTIAASLPAALELLEAGPARPAQGQQAGTAPGVVRVVLIATVDSQAYPRVRAALEAGAAAGTCGILLGDPPASASCHVGAGGMILAAGEPWLTGAHAAHLPADDAAAMLSLLRGAQGHLTPAQAAPARHRSDRPGTRFADDQHGRHRGADGDAGAGRDTRRPEHPGRPAAPHGPDQPEPPAMVPGPPESPPADGPGDGPRLPPPAAARGTSPAAASASAAISVLGPLRIAGGGCEIPGGLRKARELLAYLAVHPGGATGERISADLWPDLSAKYASSQRKLALRKAREMLRAATGLPAAKFITLTGDRYQLDPGVIAVDLWQFDTALDRARAAAGDEEQLTALQQAAALYRGPLADGAGYEWAEEHAEPARRRAVDALARIAAILQPRQPEDALNVLETAITHDPYNEAVYQALMRIQVRLGRPDAAARTLALLRTRLTALGLTPAPATRQAAGIPDGTPAPGHGRGATTATPGSPRGTGQRAGGPGPPPGRHRA